MTAAILKTAILMTFLTANGTVVLVFMAFTRDLGGPTNALLVAAQSPVKNIDSTAETVATTQ